MIYQKNQSIDIVLSLLKSQMFLSQILLLLLLYIIFKLLHQLNWMENQQSNQNIRESNNIMLHHTADEIKTSLDTNPPYQNKINQIKSFNLDDLPVGGNKKFAISQFPDQNAPIKPAIKKIIKKQKPQVKDIVDQTEKKQQKSISQTTDIKQKPIQNNNTGTLNQKLPQINNPNDFDQKPIGKSNFNVSQFDQKPIGKSNFKISQFPDGQQPPEQKPINLTIQQKLKHKNIKIRMSAFEELLELFRTKTISQSPLSELQFDKLLKQTNPGCLEKIILCFQEWVNNEGNWGDQEIKLIIQNGFINGKGTSKKISTELIDNMYQKKSVNFENVILSGLKGKNMKIVTGYITVINDLLAIYGIKKLNYLKPYYPDVIKLISTQKLPAIKVEGMNMLKESLKWLGKPFVQPYLKANNLKQGLVKQLDAFWEGYDKNIVMTAPKGEVIKPGQKPAKIDLRAIAQQVDIFKKFNEKWVQNVLKTEKWKQKCDAMNQLVKEANVPKIANTDHRHISDLVKRLINDSNFNVVLMILKILAVISQGLRKPFAPIVKTYFSNVISKFRDRKTQMIDQTKNCLNQFYYVINLQDVIDDVKQGLSDKNPNLKEQLINWIQKYIQRKYSQKALNQKGREAIKNLMPCFQKLCNDGAAEVRQATYKALGKMKSSLGDNFFSALQTKLKRVFPNPGGKAPQIKIQQQLTKVHSSSLSKSNVMSSNQIKLITNKEAIKSERKIQEKIEKVQDYQIPTFEQCYQQLLNQGLTEDQLNVVNSTVAKQKIEFLQTTLKQKIQEINFQAVIKFLRKMCRDWKQSNLVLNKQLMSFLIQYSQKITTRELVIILPLIIEKLGDTKFIESIKLLTDVICEKIPSKFIVNKILLYLKPSETKKIFPKINGQSCSYLAQIIDRVSLNNLPIKQLIQFAKQSFLVTISKKGAINLFKKIYEYIGQSIKNHIDQNLFKSLQPEFKKTNLLSDSEKKPKITFRGQAIQGLKEERTAQKISSFNPQSIPKADISLQVARWLPKLNDQKNWQNRKDAVEALDNLLTQSQNRVHVKGLQQLFNNLKGRINDSNKSLCKLFVNFTGHLFESVGKEIKPFSRPLISALVDALSDKNEAIRKDSVNVLLKISQNLGIQNVISCMAAPLQTDKVELRLQVLNFLVNNQQCFAKVEVKQFVKGIINCLSDKNKQIRNLSQKLLQKAVQKINIQLFRNVAQDFRPAFIKQLKSIFDKFDKNVQNSQNGQSNNTIKGASPARPDPNLKKPPLSAKKQTQLLNNNSTTALTRTLTQKSLNQKQIPLTTSVSSTFQGDQQLAMIKYLSAYRQSRQQIDELSPWSFETIKDDKQEQLIEELYKIFRKDIAVKMISMNYRKVNDAGMILSKMCKDLAQQSSLRQIYDVILKWIFLRIWGGISAVFPLIQILPQLLAILQKKSLIINENQVLLVIGILREYFIGISQFRVPDQIHTTIKCLIKLNSGDKILKAILKQFNTDITTIHKYLRKQINGLYKECLCKIVKSNLMDFIGNQESLSEIVKIKQLSKDPQFIQMLYQRFNENGLNGYGFSKNVLLQNKNFESSPNLNVEINAFNTNVNMNPNLHANKLINMTQNNSSINLRPQLSQSKIQTQSQEKHPQIQVQYIPPSKNLEVPHQNYLQQTTYNSPNLSNSQMKNSNLSTQKRPQIPPTSPLIKVQSQTNIHQQSTNNLVSQQLSMRLKQSNSFNQQISLEKRLKFQNYPTPPASNPLREHLLKIVNPEESTMSILKKIFEQQEKFIVQFQTFAKCILASILKGTMYIFNNRNEYTQDSLILMLKLLESTIKNKQINRNVNQVLGITIQFILKQLVYEDENKVAITQSLKQRKLDYKPDLLIRAINGVMLRILQNSNPHYITIVLFDVLIKNMKKPETSQKTLSLILKCIGRITEYKQKSNNYYMLEFDESNLKELFLKFHEYYTDLQFKLKPQDQGLIIIKNLLTEIAKHMKQNIWISYEKAMKDTQIQDQFISKHLQFLKIPYPQKPKVSQKQQQLKRITQLLSKVKTYDSGIQSLNKFLDLNPDFNINQYFSNLNYENKFINKVLSSLESIFKRPTIKIPIIEKPEKKSQQKKYPISEIIPVQQHNIQNKIRNLRQKFDQFNSQTPSQKQQQSTPIMNRQQDPDPDRASQIRRRITEMKAKIHNVMR